MLPDWLRVMEASGFDARGLRFYFRNATDLLLFGTLGKHACTWPWAGSKMNIIASRKREHSRQPEEHTVRSLLNSVDGNITPTTCLPNWRQLAVPAETCYMHHFENPTVVVVSLS